MQILLALISCASKFKVRDRQALQLNIITNSVYLLLDRETPKSEILKFNPFQQYIFLKSFEQPLRDRFPHHQPYSLIMKFLP